MVSYLSGNSALTLLCTPAQGDMLSFDLPVFIFRNEIGMMNASSLSDYAAKEVEELWSGSKHHM